ncbi:MAG TPA: zinc metalloprotease [Marmoricola sp.]|nr:zinc metalloprotease [Marmoricola sp.]
MTLSPRRVSLALVVMLSFVALTLVPPPAGAKAGPDHACVQERNSRPAPKHRQAMLRDHSPVHRNQISGSSALLRTGALRPLPARVNIPVRVHVIRGKHRRERGPNRTRVRALIRILNGGFAGVQSADSVPTRFRFNLRSIDYTRNDSWYHAYNYSPPDTRAKRRLHRGNKRTLNVYINGGGVRNQPVLGWSRLPWQQPSSPRLDGISVNVAALPGGAAVNYNLGDTIIHETGHWLGLLHPWQGGCADPNDGVADTPATAGPSYYCDDDADTCTAPGLDPIRNFMNYSYDICLNQFTAGQVARMDRMWAEWRS